MDWQLIENKLKDRKPLKPNQRQVLAWLTANPKAEGYTVAELVDAEVLPLSTGVLHPRQALMKVMRHAIDELWRKRVIEADYAGTRYRTIPNPDTHWITSTSRSKEKLKLKADRWKLFEWLVRHARPNGYSTAEMVDFGALPNETSSRKSQMDLIRRAVDDLFNVGFVQVDMGARIVRYRALQPEPDAVTRPTHTDLMVSPESINRLLLPEEVKDTSDILRIARMIAGGDTDAFFRATFPFELASDDTYDRYRGMILDEALRVARSETLRALSNDELLGELERRLGKGLE